MSSMIYFGLAMRAASEARCVPRCFPMPSVINSWISRAGVRLFAMSSMRRPEWMELDERLFACAPISDPMSLDAVVGEGLDSRAKRG